MKNKTKKLLILLSLLIFILVACDKKETNEIVEVHNPTDVISEENENKNEENSKEEEIVDIDPKEKIDLSLNPNEAGEIMILMYHNIGSEEAEWTRTPENFKKDLLTLYEKGYRIVSLKDFVNNNIDIGAGKTPVVITFDDGNENNFRIIKDSNGKDIIDPDSAIGILEAFKNQYPDFGVTATFFIFGQNPFRQPEFIDYKLNYLIENGYDIGNHTIDHRSMRSIEDEEKIQEALGKQVKIINEALPEYEVNTYALCYGERPKNKDLERYLERGSYEGVSYENIAILNVGWNPAHSPITNKFNPLSLPRIRASETKVDNVGLYNWLEYFDKNPDKRYISDGVKEVVTVPKYLEETIDLNRLGDKELYMYGE